MSSGITIEILHDDKRVMDLLKRISRRLNKTKPAMEEIAEIVKSSIQRNFRAEGRPVTWPKSAMAIDRGGKTLSKTGGLKTSFTARGTKDAARVGTNKEYAAVHHFGISKRITERVRAHERNISQAFGRPLKKGPRDIQVGAFTRSRQMDLPARPFMVIQEEDWDEIRAALMDYLRGK